MTSRDTQAGHRPCRAPRIRPTKQVAPGPLMSRLSLCAARYPHTSEVHAAGGFHITFYNNIAEETAVRQAAESERDAAPPRRSGCGRSCAACAASRLPESPRMSAIPALETGNGLD
jgi:hypothetical protein